MSDNKNGADAQVLHWSGKVFSADDMRRHWTSQSELILLPRTLLTPLALDELRARGVRVTRQEATSRGERHVSGNSAGHGWAYIQEKHEPVVAAAVAALEREGMAFTALDSAGNARAAWLRGVVGWVDHNAGAVLFCNDAALSCCLANKAVGVRAAAVANALQTGRAVKALGVNVLVVELPGRTFFEIRQILRTAAGAGAPVCPPEIAKLLQEFEGHAHR